MPHATSVPKNSDVEEEFKQVNAYLGAIVENIPDMTLVKHDGTLPFELFNRIGEEMLG